MSRTNDFQIAPQEAANSPRESPSQKFNDVQNRVRHLPRLHDHTYRARRYAHACPSDSNEVSDAHARTLTRHAFLFAAFLRFFIAPARRKCAATAIQLRRFGVLVFFFFIPKYNHLGADDKV